MATGGWQLAVDYWSATFSAKGRPENIFRIFLNLRFCHKARKNNHSCQKATFLRARVESQGSMNSEVKCGRPGHQEVVRTKLCAVLNPDVEAQPQGAASKAGQAHYRQNSVLKACL